MKPGPRPPQTKDGDEDSSEFLLSLEGDILDEETNGIRGVDFFYKGDRSHQRGSAGGGCDAYGVATGRSEKCSLGDWILLLVSSQRLHL